MFNAELDRKNNEKEFMGIYRGEVVDSNDPLRAGRVRVRVFGVYDDFEVSTIPWALFADPFMNGQSGFGGFFVPDIGSHVFVMFEAGDPCSPVYIAGAPANGDGPDERLTDYPQNHVFKTRTGHVFEFNDAGIIHVAHSSGTEVTVDASGNVIENVVGDVTRTIEGNVTETISGNYTRSVSGDSSESTGGSYSQDVSGSTSMSSSSMSISSGSVNHDGVDIGNDHVHSQPNDSDGDTQFDTNGPKAP